MPLTAPPFRRRLATGLALALVVAAARETQKREHARLRFTRAEGLDTCPTEEELHGAIVARLGYDPFDGEETAPLLRIRFVRRDRRFAALFSRGEDDDIARTVESASCGELLAPTAIAGVRDRRAAVTRTGAAVHVVAVATPARPRSAGGGVESNCKLGRGAAA